MIRLGTRAGSALIAVTVAAVVAGCTGSASINYTLNPEALADEASRALQEAAGTTEGPDIDCGEDQIDVVAGEQVICALSVEGDPDVYDAVVTFTNVEGTDYSFDVQVAETPRA